MIKRTSLFFSVLSLFLLTSCKATEEVAVTFEEGVNAEVFYPKDQRSIRTPDGANALDLETPLRCNVNWKTQQMVITLPFNNSILSSKI